MGKFRLTDGALTASVALPSSTTAVASSGLDLGVSSRGSLDAACEAVISAPALTTAQLPDTKTMTYTLETAAAGDSIFASPTTIASWQQTGAGGAGAAAQAWRAGLPSSTSRYLRLKATPSTSGTGDASAATATLALAF